MAKDHRLYWIWMQQALPLGSAAADRVMRMPLSPDEVYAADAGTLREWGFAPKDIQRLSDRSLDAANRILQAACTDTDWVLTPDDRHYPSALRDITGAPLVLYCRGDMPDLEDIPVVGVVGTRRASESGRRHAERFGTGLTAGGAVIVTGGAVGIDAAANAGAVRAGGPTIVVRACPLTEEYPLENAELRRAILQNGGALLTEFPPGSRVKCDFHIRNRLISGMSDGVCLIEAPARSGSLITARWAQEQGRDVYAVPGDVLSHRYDGAHRAIQQGAVLVTDPVDILKEYQDRYEGILDIEAAEQAVAALPTQPTAPRPAARPAAEHPSPPPAPKPPAPLRELPDTVSDAARQVWAHLGDEPLPVDQLAAAAGLPMPRVLVALTELEIGGWAENHAGQRYCRK